MDIFKARRVKIKRDYNAVFQAVFCILITQYMYYSISK